MSPVRLSFKTNEPILKVDHLDNMVWYIVGRGSRELRVNKLFKIGVVKVMGTLESWIRFGHCPLVRTGRKDSRYVSKGRTYSSRRFGQKLCGRQGRYSQEIPVQSPNEISSVQLHILVEFVLSRQILSFLHTQHLNVDWRV